MYVCNEEKKCAWMYVCKYVWIYKYMSERRSERIDSVSRHNRYCKSIKVKYGLMPYVVQFSLLFSSDAMCWKWMLAITNRINESDKFFLVFVSFNKILCNLKSGVDFAANALIYDLFFWKILIFLMKIKQLICKTLFERLNYN